MTEENCETFCVLVLVTSFRITYLMKLKIFCFASKSRTTAVTNSSPWFFGIVLPTNSKKSYPAWNVCIKLSKWIDIFTENGYKIFDNDEGLSDWTSNWDLLWSYDKKQENQRFVKEKERREKERVCMYWRAKNKNCTFTNAILFCCSFIQILALLKFNSATFSQSILSSPSSVQSHIIC